MAYLEAATKFWRISSDGSDVTTTYGKLGSTGQTTLKSFDDAAKADKFLLKQIGDKKKKGYADAVDPAAPKSGAKRKAAASKPAAKKAKAAPAKAAKAAAAPKPSKAAAKKPAAKSKKAAAPTKQKKGLGGLAAAPDSDDEEDGTVALDSGVAGVNKDVADGAWVAFDDEAEPWSAKLAQIDAATNTDKYYILQLLEHDDQIYLYRRNGRTGTAGQAQLDKFDDIDAGSAEFCKLFKTKTGLAWDSKTAAAKAKKYTYLKQDIAARKGAADEDATWEYHLTNDPHGKPNGWYPYDRDNGDEVEELYATFHVDGNTGMSVRYVASASSGFTYRVDMTKYTQANTQSNKERPIRRVVE